MPMTRYADPEGALRKLLFLALNPGVAWINVDDDILKTQQLTVQITKAQKFQ